VTDFIREKQQVAEPDKTRVHGGRAARPDLPDTGLIHIIGLHGSGKTAVAARMAEQLGVRAAELPLEGAREALEALTASGPAVIAVPHKLLTDATLRQRLRETGRVLYLMADAGAIAARLAAGPEDREAQRQKAARQLAAFEPWFMQTLHLLVPASGPLDEVAAEALERARL
jgi:shikimate kinase